jgi:putative toxin-antitoxin system antitoxin component (TIGR02293 family)
VFDDPQLARKWLKEPSWALGDVIPLQYADTELGAQEVEDLLGRIEHGVFT